MALMSAADLPAPLLSETFFGRSFSNGMPDSRVLARHAAWVFFALSLGGVVWLAYELIRLWQVTPGSPEAYIYRSDSGTVAVLTLFVLIIGVGLRLGHKWAMWLAIGVVIAVATGSLMAPFVVGCLAAGVFMMRRGFAKAIVLPLTFLVIIAPGGIFYLSGKGGHMSFLLLFPFALPWTVFLYRVLGSEPASDLAGALINALLIGALGAWRDRHPLVPSP